MFYDLFHFYAYPFKLLGVSFYFIALVEARMEAVNDGAEAAGVVEFGGGVLVRKACRGFEYGDAKKSLNLLWGPGSVFILWY